MPVIGHDAHAHQRKMTRTNHQLQHPSLPKHTKHDSKFQRNTPRKCFSRRIKITIALVLLALFVLYSLNKAESDCRSDHERKRAEKEFTIQRQGLGTPSNARVISAAHRAADRNTYGNYALIQTVSSNYINAIKNWICNVKEFAGVLDATVFIAFDAQARHALYSMDREFNVVFVPMYFSRSANKSVKHLEMLKHRTALLRAVLESDVGLLLLPHTKHTQTEWLRNGLQEVATLELSEESYDLLSSGIESESGNPSMQVGFQLYRPSINSKALWFKIAEHIKLVAAKLKRNRSEMSSYVSEQEMIKDIEMPDGFNPRYLPQMIVSKADKSAIVIHTATGQFLYYRDNIGNKNNNDNNKNNDDKNNNNNNNKCTHPDPLHRNVFQATLTVLTMSRAESLTRLLQSIADANYGDSDVRIIIRIDKPGEAKYTAGYQRVLKIADKFQENQNRNIGKFTGGVFVEIQATNQGLKKQWFSSFQTPRSWDEIGVILEDDLEVSPHYFTWVRFQWENHGNNPYLGSVSLQRQTLRPTDGGYAPIINKHRPFLYRLIGTWGLSVRAALWKDFTSTYKDRMDVEIPGLVTTKWFLAPSSIRSMWSQHFIHYLWTKNQFTLFVNLPSGVTLSSNWKEPGEHYSGAHSRDFPNLKEYDKDVMEVYDEELNRYDFDAELVVGLGEGGVFECSRFMFHNLN